MPSPKVNSPQTMDLPKAMYAVIDGEKITKLEWGNTEYYGVLRDGWLMLHKPDGNFYNWIISAGDLRGKDWIILHDTPVL